MKRITFDLEKVNFDDSLNTIVGKALNFRIETVGGKVPPKTRRKRGTGANTKYDLHNSSVAKAIMDHFSPGVEFGSHLAYGWTGPAGFSKGGTSACLTYLVRSGYVERLRPGRFKFLKPL